MENTAEEWYFQQHLKLLIKLENRELSIVEYGVQNQEILDEAKEIERQQKDDFVIDFAEWKDINCIYYDGWNIRVPLGDKYSDVYTNKELLEIYKKEKKL